MKAISLLEIGLVCAVVGLAVGCTSYQGAGEDKYYYNNGYGVPVNPASPTMRPGMNPYDPRDPNALTRPWP